MSNARNQVTATIAGMHTHNERQAAIKDAMKSLAEDVKEGDEFRQDFLELLPVEYLFHTDVVTSTVLIKNLRALIDAAGIRISRRAGRMIALCIAEELYSGADLDTAKELISASRATHISSSSATTRNMDTPNPSNAGRYAADPNRLVDATAKHFSTRAQYSGVLAESPSLSEIRSNYLAYCSDKGMSVRDKVKLIHYALKGPAWTYWSEILRDDQSLINIGLVFAKLSEKFDTPSHQRQVEHLLESMNLDQTMKSMECGRVKALGQMYHEVDRLNPQITPSKRGDNFKSDQLLHIVQDRVWAQEARKKLLQNNISFAQLYSELSASALLWEQTTRNQGLNPADHPDLIPGTGKYSTAHVHFGARYARGNMHRNRVNRSTTQSRTPTDKSKQSCYRCGKLGHYAFECHDKNRLSMTEAVRSRIRNSSEDPNKAAARVLLEMAFECDSRDADVCSEADEELVENTFEALLNSTEEQSFPKSDEQTEDFHRPDSH